MIYSDVVIELCCEEIREYLNHSARSPISWTFDTDGSNLRTRSESLADNRGTAWGRRASSRGATTTTAGSTSGRHVLEENDDGE